MHPNFPLFWGPKNQKKMVGFVKVYKNAYIWILDSQSGIRQNTSKYIIFDNVHLVS